ncbi:ATP-binding protein [Streptomyces sp. RFCAC02]|uniref:ATP-binding protein n=1 Tax=Streptomyces sp. RFCAC02 TaxID=2499143 RepID=UPI00143D15C3|nr:ATP-binding protein [Streptomyces sp. RFCAC02]
MHPSLGTTQLPHPRGPLADLRERRDRFELPALPVAVAAARGRAGERLSLWGIGGDTRDTALLVISELVTNAVLHSGGNWVVCRIATRGDTLRIEVTDEGAGPEPEERAPHHPPADDECGRGLLLLDALAHRWGILSPDAAGGCTVWSEITRGAGAVRGV